jgi:hypothetical protein
MLETIACLRSVAHREPETSLHKSVRALKRHRIGISRCHLARDETSANGNFRETEVRDGSLSGKRE